MHGALSMDEQGHPGLQCRLWRQHAHGFALAHGVAEQRIEGLLTIVGGHRTRFL